jgi:hypothetical protein
MEMKRGADCPEITKPVWSVSMMDSVFRIAIQWSARPPGTGSSPEWQRKPGIARMNLVIDCSGGDGA